MNPTVIAVVILLAGISAAAAARDTSPPLVTPNLLGLDTRPTLTPGVDNSIDSTPTSAIPEIQAPTAITPATVPNDSLGRSVEPPLTSPEITVPLAPMPAN